MWRKQMVDNQDFEEQELDNDGGFNDGWYFHQKWHCERGDNILRLRQV